MRKQEKERQRQEKISLKRASEGSKKVAQFARDAEVQRKIEEERDRQRKQQPPFRYENGRKGYYHEYWLDGQHYWGNWEPWTPPEREKQMPDKNGFTKEQLIALLGKDPTKGIMEDDYMRIHQKKIVDLEKEKQIIEKVHGGGHRSFDEAIRAALAEAAKRLQEDHERQIFGGYQGGSGEKDGYQAYGNWYKGGMPPHEGGHNGQGEGARDRMFTKRWGLINGKHNLHRAILDDPAMAPLRNPLAQGRSVVISDRKLNAICDTMGVTALDVRQAMDHLGVADVVTERNPEFMEFDFVIRSKMRWEKEPHRV